MRALTLAVLLAGCTGGPGATPSPPAPAAATASPTAPTTDASATMPTASPSVSAVPNMAYTAEDEGVARVIRAGAEEAIPQLELLSDMDPSKLEDLFVPLGTWITGQLADVDAYTPSSCTAAAVAAYVEGIDYYDDLRKTFLAWRDWGANGRPFAPGAPRQVVALLEVALAELDAHCPA